MVRRAATATAVSGQLATASGIEVNGATGPPPNRFGYQVCTAAWFLASHGTPGSRCRRRSVMSSSCARLKFGAVEECDVYVTNPVRIEAGPEAFIPEKI